ncbi:MAG: RIP metalloprotease RseP [Candidatus Muproteobacteria bacterium RBG_19FT_COMBO_61_10]|uniref:Zinc metalloprotease n=1 Tax=Candidatus Muproteobacteria bacterium RBG_19FT_COMBO_61_10 TaxID=1817761 RepID=A0A1F6UPA0_9PROT|nr:MAG: RIP metalloprotease RseP [Candidatus Muproteobacteria bacterium RBG_19FT_COMBO_61_10]
MIGFLYTLIAFVVAISVLVVVHEFGHYWVARRMGVKVLRFSLGFGKPLWMRRFGRDQTEWVIAAVPLGGYVKMLDEHEGKVAEKDLARAFNRQPTFKRVAIVVAGPLFNFLFAILAYSILNMTGIEGLRPVVGKVAESSLAQQAGFRKGDEFITIDGYPVQSWDQRRLYLYERALDRATVTFTVRDLNGLTQERALDLSSLSAADVGAGLLERQIGLFPPLPELEPVIGTLDERGAAALAGLQVGDRVTAIDGQPVKTWQDMVKTVSARPEVSLRLRVQRNGATQEFSVTPQSIESAGQRIGRIGVGVRIPELPAELRVMVRHAPLSALAEGVETTWRMSALTLKMLGKMLMLEVSTKTISGPLTIAQYAGASAQIGLDRFVMFLAVVSISLGVLNLLPIPVLDGGHLLIYLIEGIQRKPLSETALHWGQQIGIALLIALMALAFYNDFMRILY